MPLNQLDEPQYALGVAQIACDALLNCIQAHSEQALLNWPQKSSRTCEHGNARGVNALVQ